jgi:hypothetical protein
MLVVHASTLNKTYLLFILFIELLNSRCITYALRILVGAHAPHAPSKSATGYEPVVGSGLWTGLFFCKLSSHHRFIFLLILKKKLRKLIW